MRAGQKRKSARKFFPGYVLVEMAMDEEAWHLVKSVPRVLRLYRWYIRSPYAYYAKRS